MKKLFVILTFTFGVTAGCAIDLPTVTQAADADGGGNCSGCRASRNSPPSGASSRFCHFTDWPTQRVGATWRSPLAVLVLGISLGGRRHLCGNHQCSLL